MSVLTDDRKLLHQQTLIPSNREQLKNMYQSKLVSAHYDMSECNKISLYNSVDWSLTDEHVYNVYEKICFCCGYNKTLQKDHITSISLNPERALDFYNVQLLCTKCHRKKLYTSCVSFPKRYKNEKQARIYLKNNHKAIISIKHDWENYFYRIKGTSINELWSIAGMLADNVTNKKTDYYRGLIADYKQFNPQAPIKHHGIDWYNKTSGNDSETDNLYQASLTSALIK